MTDWLGLNGKRCVNTGASNGIGKGIAEALGRAGAHLLLLDSKHAVMPAQIVIAPGESRCASTSRFL